MTNKDSSTNSSDSYSLQFSTNSSFSCDSDISSLSLLDKEVANFTNQIDEDELPAFEIRLLSPLGRSPSPIDSDLDNNNSSPTKSCITPTRKKISGDNHKTTDDFIPLHDINAQISPPSDSDSSINNQTPCNTPSISNLETIFEGVFLNTPPKQKLRNSKTTSKQRNNLLERIALNRLSFVPSSDDKENLSAAGCRDSDDTMSTLNSTSSDG